jgi:N-acetyl-anhydromuramyl-L-alanine amidase AmpD
MNTRVLLGLASLAAFVPGVARATVAKPAVHWVPAASGNYTPASRTRLSLMIIHKAEGTASGAAQWFENPASKVSAHYSVAHDGTIFQSVADKDIAWHAGNWDVNTRSIGVEHGGYTANDDVSETQYRRSAQLIAALCLAHKIPIDRRHIIGHSEVPDPNHAGQFGGADHHTDPGKHWNWSHYMSLVKQFAQTAPKPKPKPPAPRPTDSASFAGATGNMALVAGQPTRVTIAYRNTGSSTWEPATTFVDEASHRTGFRAPISQKTGPTQTGTFVFDVNVRAGAKHHASILEQLELVHGGKVVASSVVGVKFEVQ